MQWVTFPPSRDPNLTQVWTSIWAKVLWWTRAASSYQIFNTLILKLFLISAGGKHFLSFFQLLGAKSELRPVYLMRTHSSLLTALWNSLSALWPWMWMENLWGFYVLPVAPSLTTFNVLSDTHPHILQVRGVSGSTQDPLTTGMPVLALRLRVQTIMFFTSGAEAHYNGVNEEQM